MDDWKTRKGHRVWVEQTARGDFLRCDGCGARRLITGVSPSAFTARAHARECTKGR